MDALLRGGRTRFSDIADRMEDALRARGITDPAAWLARGAGKLDRAVAETVTLIVDDILVDRLLARLRVFPLAHQLFVAASVFRAPVDATGLNPVLEVRCYLGFGAVALVLGNDDEATRFSEAARDHAWEEIYRQHTLLEGIPERTQLRSVVGIAYCSTSRVRRSVCCGRLNP